MSRVSGALCSLLSDAGGALLVVGNRGGGEHLLHVERQCGGWHVDVVVEQESTPRAQSAAQAPHQSVRLRLLRRKFRRGAPNLGTPCSICAARSIGARPEEQSGEGR
jgi:hypothetical protein